VVASTPGERLPGCSTRIQHRIELRCLQPVEEIRQRPSSNGTARTAQEKYFALQYRTKRLQHLHGAATMGQPSIIRFLVEKGARLDARNKLGWTPLMVTQGMLIAANARFYPLTEALIKQLMVERGMDPAKKQPAPRRQVALM